MKYVEFKKFTEENGGMPVYLFEGEEVYFRNGGVNLLKRKFLADETLDLAVFEGSALKGDKLKNLVDAVNCFPFLSEKRIVKVTEFYPTDKEFDYYLKDLFADPPKAGMLVIVNEGKGKAGCAELRKKPGVTYVDCGRADEETIKKWIYVTCKREGVFIDGVTAGKLAAYCVNDMSRIAGETEKLLIYCRARSLNRLTDEIVDEIVYPDSEYKIYELAGALSRKNYSAFVHIMNELRTKGFDELALLNSLSYYFRTLYEVSEVKGRDAEVAAALGLKEYAVKKNREQAAKFQKGVPFQIYSAVYGAICSIKNGELTPASALETVTAQLFFGF